MRPHVDFRSSDEGDRTEDNEGFSTPDKPTNKMSADGSLVPRGFDKVEKIKEMQKTACFDLLVNLSTFNTLDANQEDSATFVFDKFDIGAYRVFYDQERFEAYQQTVEELNGIPEIKTVLPRGMKFSLGNVMYVFTPLMTKLEVPKDKTKREELHETLKSILEKLWKNNFVHNDVVKKKEMGNFLIKTDNFMKDGDRIVIIDFESIQNKKDDSQTIENERKEFDAATWE